MQFHNQQFAPFNVVCITLQAARARRNVAGQSITASQLAIALQAATASGRVPGSPQASAAIPSTSQMVSLFFLFVLFSR